MKANITIGEKYGPAMKITAQAEADAYFEECVRHSIEWFNMTREEAEALERTNLGYYAGYYDNVTRARVERLFLCEHPLLGSIAKNGSPTVDHAIVVGVVRARRP